MHYNKLILPLAIALCLPLSAQSMAADAAPEKEKAPAQEQKIAEPAYLGVAIGPVPQAVQAQLPADITQNQGLMVMRVVPGSPAEKAGILRHDVLLSFNGKPLIAPVDLVQQVHAAKAGDKAAVEVLRHGKVMKLESTLAANPHTRHPRHHRMMPMPWHMAPADNGKPLVEEHFESFTLEKDANGQYTAKVQTRDQDGNEQNFEFKGSSDEIRQQVKQHKDLPPAQKRQLLNALDDRGPIFPSMPMPDFEQMDEDFFMPPPWFRQQAPRGFWD